MSRTLVPTEVATRVGRMINGVLTDESMRSPAMPIAADLTAPPTAAVWTMLGDKGAPAAWAPAATAAVAAAAVSATSNILVARNMPTLGIKC